MIQRSALPKGVITKLVGDTKLVRILAGCLKTQEVITMGDLRLLKFDINRCINQQQVLVLDSNNVKYDIILGTNFFPKQASSWITQERIWNGLISPFHFVHLANSMPWKICPTYKSKPSSLVKIGSNALQPRFWTQRMRKQM
jgi:hypothetical protein